MAEKDLIEELYEILRNRLPVELTYHSIDHTIDVHKVCKFYMKHYALSEEDSCLLEIAAVGHDVGFTETYTNHEERGAKMTCALMEQYAYSKEEQEIVSQLILATKIPQKPTTFLSQILCDADLDYLGRFDFATIGTKLMQEWLNYNIVPNLEEHFDDIQISFLKSHNYHTPYAQEFRAPVKEVYIQELIRKEEAAALNRNS